MEISMNHIYVYFTSDASQKIHVKQCVTGPQIPTINLNHSCWDVVDTFAC